MYRFTIRDLLWLTVVVAVLIAWLLDRAAMVREREAQRAGQEALKANQRALRAELQKMKEQKPPWELRGDGGMFGSKP